MHVSIKAIRMAQRHLGFNQEEVDGILGEGTENALDQALKARKDDLDPRYTNAILEGSRKRKLTAYIQLLAEDRGIETGPVDGYWGPQTDYAFDNLKHLEEHGELPRSWRDIQPTSANPNNWPLERGSELVASYGGPGTNLTTVEAPYVHRLSWDLSTQVMRFSCHEKVADSIVRVLTAVLDHYGYERIKELRLDRWGGCYNKRKKRGGTEWSTHAWGIALDYDPERNRLNWSQDKAAFAGPEYDNWWEFWEEEGWVSLGRVANFDWMHVQAARRL
ncbi:MAG: M15 family peptidase [Thermodesulfobacteriota bacterium]|nr:M15 family peptidase [Thermodesulfobacteriota bacterium]